MTLTHIFSLLLLVVALAGCGSGGGSGLFSALGDSFTSGVSSGGSSGADSISSGFSDSGASGAGAQVALVHNPEPATMLLWGAGLVGAALSRRRKNNNVFKP